MRSMCVGVAETGVGAYDDPRRYLKKLFLSYFCMTKSTKSHLRGFFILLKISFRVHELVARAVRDKCVRQMAERKSVVLHSP